MSLLHHEHDKLPTQTNWSRICCNGEHLDIDSGLPWFSGVGGFW